MNGSRELRGADSILADVARTGRQPTARATCATKEEGVAAWTKQLAGDDTRPRLPPKPRQAPRRRGRADEGAHLQPIQRARTLPDAVKKAKSRKAAPPMLDEPTALELRLETIGELRETSQRVTKILDEYAEQDRSIPRVDADLGRLIVDNVFRTSEGRRADVSAALESAETWTSSINERLVETEAAEADTSDLVQRIATSNAGLERALAMAGKTQEHIRGILERVRAEAQKDHDANQQMNEENQAYRRELLERTAREVEQLVEVADAMRAEAQRSKDESTLMEAQVIEMAAKAKAARLVADTVREESARELERMEALVAAVQEQDRLANLKWRDPRMAEKVDEIIGMHKRQKADAALAQAGESGADAELVAAVDQARKATMKAEAEAEAEAARRTAHELRGQLEAMSREHRKVEHQRDAALDDLRRAHLALEALGDQDDVAPGAQDDAELDALRAALTAEKQKSARLTQELEAEKAVSDAARKAAEAFEERNAAPEAVAVDTPVEDHAEALRAAQDEVARLWQKLQEALAERGAAAEPATVVDHTDALRAAQEEVAQLRKRLKAAQDELRASQSTVEAREPRKEEPARAAAAPQGVETQDGGTSPLKLEVVERGSRARTPVSMEDGSSSPMRSDARETPVPAKDGRGDALQAQVHTLQAQLAAKTDECEELRKRLAALDGAAPAAPAAAPVAQAPAPEAEDERISLTEALRSIGTVLPDVARSAVLDAHRKRVSEAHMELRDALAAKPVRGERRGSRALLRVIEEADAVEGAAEAALREASEADGRVAHVLEAYLEGGDSDQVDAALNAHYASAHRNDAEALREKHRKLTEELEAERRRKLELATQKTELARHVEELTAFLKQAHAALEEERQRAATTDAREAPSGDEESKRADETETEVRSGLEATFAAACVLLRTKARVMAAKATAAPPAPGAALKRAARATGLLAQLKKSAAEKAEAARVAAAEAARLEAERLAAAGTAAENAARLEAERLERERLAAEAAAAEQARARAEAAAEAQRLEAARLAAEAARIEAERLQAERPAAEPVPAPDTTNKAMAAHDAALSSANDRTAAAEASAAARVATLIVARSADRAAFDACAAALDRASAACAALAGASQAAFCACAAALARSSAKCQRLAEAVASGSPDTISRGEHEDRLAELREAAAAELRAAREAADVLMADLEARHAAALDAERRTHRDALDALKTAHGEAMHALEAEAATALARARDDLAAMRARFHTERDTRAANNAQGSLARWFPLDAARQEAEVAAINAPPEEERPPRPAAPEPAPVIVACASPDRASVDSFDAATETPGALTVLDSGYFSVHGYSEPPADSPLRFVEVAVRAADAARAIMVAVAKLLGASSSNATALAEAVATAAHTSEAKAALTAVDGLAPLLHPEMEEDIEEAPKVEGQDVFEARLASFLEDGTPALADAASDLGRLGVERRTYFELKERVHGDALAIVEKRLAALDAFSEEVAESTIVWSVESLAVCRHENAQLARKARAMAGWRAAVGSGGGDDLMKVYEEAAAALAAEIARRGGWRAACTLKNGAVNEAADPVPWPDREALKITTLLKDYFCGKYHAAEGKRLELADAMEQLANRYRLLEQKLGTSNKRREVLEKKLRGLVTQARAPPQQPLSADDVHAASFDLDAYFGLGGARSAAAHIDAGPVIKAWQDERTALVTQRVEVARVLAAVMASPLAEAVQTKLAPVDVAALRTARDEARVRVRADAMLPSREAPLEVTNSHRGKAPLFPDVASRPASAVMNAATALDDADALAPRTPPKVAVAYEASRVADARRLLEKVRRGMRGLGGYAGSDDKSEALAAEVKAALEADEGDLRTLLRVFALVQRRNVEQEAIIEVLERELNITATTEVTRLLRMTELEKAHDDAPIIENLHARLREAHSDADRFKAEADAVREGLSQGVGALEQLEATLATHRDVADVHEVLLPRYHEADLQAQEAMARVTTLRAKADAKDKVAARDLLERRLLLVFNEVQAVEDAMLALYERVEQATQYVFSGESYRNLLVWAADKEAPNQSDDTEGALRLKKSIAAAVAPVRQLLPQSNPLAPKPPPTSGISGRDRYASLARLAGNVGTPAVTARPRPTPAKKSPRQLKPIAAVSAAPRPIM